MGIRKSQNLISKSEKRQRPKCLPSNKLKIKIETIKLILLKEVEIYSITRELDKENLDFEDYLVVMKNTPYIFFADS